MGLTTNYSGDAAEYFNDPNLRFSIKQDNNRLQRNKFRRYKIKRAYGSWPVNPEGMISIVTWDFNPGG